MKHQYVGDINDYRKYALLRALSAGGANRIGVCWMLTPDDGGTHGGKTKWGDDMGRFDPPVSDFLQSINGHPERRNLWSIEQSGLLDAVFHSSMLPQAVGERAAYMAECRAKFADADLVFFDPDNGIEALTVKPGRKAALKYVFLDEVAAFYGLAKSVLIYQHFPMMKPKQQFVADTVERLRATTPDAAIFTFTTAHVVFFLLVHSESPARLAVAALDACGQFDPSFVRGEYLGRAALLAA